MENAVPFRGIDHRMFDFLDSDFFLDSPFQFPQVYTEIFPITAPCRGQHYPHDTHFPMFPPMENGH
jgi:hypothetical protein